LRPVSDKWKDSVTRSYIAVTRIEVLSDGEVIVNDLEIDEDARVELDFRASNRARLSCKIHDQDLIPLSETSDDVLAPFGNELRVYKGIQYSSTSTEWTSIGIFGIDDNSIYYNADERSVTVNAIDRSKKIERASFTETYVIPSGTNAVTAIEDILYDALPSLTPDDLDLIDSDVTVPLLAAQEGDDRWEWIRGLAKAVACDIYFDGDGIVTMRPMSPRSSDFTVSDGVNGVLTSVSKDQTREGMANYIIATGETSTGEPVRAVAVDNDPLSPTYYLGKFGQVVHRYTTKYIDTQAAADDAAVGVLMTMRGLVSSVTLGMVPNPALEPGDIITVNRQTPGGETLVREDQMIDSVSIDLSPLNEMALSTRSLSQVELI
jgi:hypothetical protein